MTCDMRASVITGLEFLAAVEVKEKLLVSTVNEGRGFVSWQQDVASAKQALELKIIDHLEVVMSRFTVQFADDTDAALAQLEELLPQVDWHTGIEVWSLFTDFCHPVSSLPVSSETSEEGCQSVPKHPVPKYRATCHRTGSGHNFTSPMVGHHLGGIIQDRFAWEVNLTDYDIEVVISIVYDEVTFGVALTRKSLYHRNITQFARTTLKANICAGLLRLADIQPNEIVMDPMCGSGSITLEGAITHPDSFHIAGDLQDYCVECTMTNLLALNEQRKGQGLSSLNAGVMQWDATKLPLSTNSVDVVVTDLPFGKRMGNKIDNRKLYPMFLTEAARVTPPETGRAVLLTADRTCMKRILPLVKEWWTVPRTTFIFHGGLRACIYLLRRTAKIW